MVLSQNWRHQQEFDLCLSLLFLLKFYESFMSIKLTSVALMYKQREIR